MSSIDLSTHAVSNTVTGGLVAELALPSMLVELAMRVVHKLAVVTVLELALVAVAMAAVTAVAIVSTMSVVFVEVVVRSVSPSSGSDSGG